VGCCPGGATLTEVELERLVVRLVGDATGYRAMLESAAQQTDSTAANVQSVKGRIEQYAKGLEGFARSAVGALGAAGIVASLSSLFSMFSGAERSTTKLTAAIEASGRAAGPVVEDYNKFAKAVAGSTLATAGSVKGLLQQAESFGVHGDAAKSAVKNAIALAAAKGGEASSYIRATIAMAEGNVFMLRHILHMRGVKDESEVLRRAQALIASGWKQATAETQTASGQITQLQKNLKSLFIDIGGLVAGALQPLVGALNAAVTWFRELDPGVRRAATAAVLLVGAVAAVGPAFAALAPILAPLGAIVGVVFSPWILAIGAVAGAVAVAVRAMGGWDTAWQKLKGGAASAWSYVKAKFDEFVEWAAPVWDAAVSLAEAAWSALSSLAVQAWDAVETAFVAARDFIADVWTSITGGATVNWTSIRDFVQDAIIAMEFSLTHFGQVAEFQWTGIKLGAVSAFNTVLYYFTDALPAALKWLRDEWAAIFLDVYNYTTTVFSNLGTNLVAVFRNLPGLIAGTTRWGDVWKPLTEGFTRLSKELVLPERVAGELEKQLQDDFKRQGAAIDSSYEGFRAAKLKEFADKHRKDSDKQVKDAFDIGSGIGSAMGKGFKASKWDAAIAGSAEALARVAAFKERLEGTDKDNRSAERVGKERAAAADSPEAARRAEAQAALLRDIRDAVREGNRRPGAPLRPAGL
jgi:hypothetical protein